VHAYSPYTLENRDIASSSCEIGHRRKDLYVYYHLRSNCTETALDRHKKLISQPAAVAMNCHLGVRRAYFNVQLITICAVVKSKCAV